MDTRPAGRRIRALRHRRAWRQADVAVRARVSQDAVSRFELGKRDTMSLGQLDAIARALDADLVVTVRWRAGDLDRLLDEGHAALGGAAIQLLDPAIWDSRSEVTFAIFGERGSIDILAWHEETRTLLVIEIKTELTSLEETLRRHDVKVRLGPRIAAEQFGWHPKVVARLLVLPDTTTARRRVARHDALLGGAYPARGDAVRRWLRRPAGPLAGLLFLPLPTPGAIRPRRIRGSRC